jgi:putative transposase
METHRMSERRACELMDVDRSSYRYEPRADRNTELRQRLIALAGERPRYGYRRLWILLRSEWGPINRKRVHRLYQQAGLRVRRRSRKRLKSDTVGMPILTGPNEEWSMDFVHDHVATGQRIRILTLIDSFTRECLALEVDTSIRSARVVRVLEDVVKQRGVPQRMRTDNGPEFTSRLFVSWCLNQKIRHTPIEPGKPMQNAYIESFNGKFRDECLNVNWFRNAADAKCRIPKWGLEYNDLRPHSGLDYQTPAAFARDCEAVFLLRGNFEVGGVNGEISKSENHICPW